jgi:DNA-binding MarR family transcriptional regulator
LYKILYYPKNIDEVSIVEVSNKLFESESMQEDLSIPDESSIIWLIPKVRHLLRKDLENKLADYDLSWAQWATLSRIYRTEGCNQKKLAEMSIRNGAAITRSLNILENKGLVKRENSTNDRREFLIFLTDKGYKVYKKTELVIFEAIQEIKAAFKENELEKLEALINKLILTLE